MPELPVEVVGVPYGYNWPRQNAARNTDYGDRASCVSLGTRCPHPGTQHPDLNRSAKPSATTGPVAPWHCDALRHSPLLALLQGVARGRFRTSPIGRYALLKTDPAHASLHFKRTASLWSVRVGLHYRALATEVGGDFVWF